jgi:hypothetical protein
MQNTAITSNAQTAHFDIEGNTPPSHRLSSSQKIMIAGCSALSAGCATIGSLLLAGGAGRVGPLAVEHDYGPVCYYSKLTRSYLGCEQVDHSNDRASTYNFFGGCALILAAVFGARAGYLATKQPSQQATEQR